MQFSMRISHAQCPDLTLIKYRVYKIIFIELFIITVWEKIRGVTTAKWEPEVWEFSSSQ